MTITDTQITDFHARLIHDETALSTAQRYTSVIRELSAWLGDRALTKEALMNWRDGLCVSARTVNVKVAAVNRFADHIRRPDLRLKPLKTQKSTFRPEEKMLSIDDLKRLMTAAESKGKERLALAIETIYALGLRVSELQFVTAEALNSGSHEVIIRNKGKVRSVIVTGPLLRKLQTYCEQKEIKSGPVFVARTGSPLSRTQLWGEMKSLCEDAGVESSRVFPHNLRHLFAATYFEHSSNIARLADILGHSNMNTTRIYLMTNVEELVREMEGVQGELAEE